MLMDEYEREREREHEYEHQYWHGHEHEHEHECKLGNRYGSDKEEMAAIVFYS